MSLPLGNSHILIGTFSTPERKHWNQPQSEMEWNGPGNSEKIGITQKLNGTVQEVVSISFSKNIEWDDFSALQ